MKKTDTGFPQVVLVLVADLALLCALRILGPLAIKALSQPPSGYNKIGLFFDAVYGVIAVCFWTGFVFLYQLFVYRLLKARIKSRIMWTILFLWPIALIGSYSLHSSTPRARVQSILARAELAPLPESAAEIKVFSWSTPFSGAAFLRFHATRDDIESFIDGSPVLKRAECEKYDQGDQEQFVHEASAPLWYTDQINGPGRRYRVTPKRYPHGADVIVDEGQNLVFVTLEFD